MQLDQIIRGCKKQKADCQKLLYQQYFSVFLSICTRYGNTTEEAEEMLNNGFLKIFVHIHQFENKGSFEGWMKKIMVNSCLDYLKSKQVKNHKYHSGNGKAEQDPEQFDRTLYEQNVYEEMEYEHKINAEELALYLHGLPEMTRTVFNLFVLEEYSHKEICSFLNIAERTSQWHLSNAKKMLADQILKNRTVKKVIGL